MPSKYSLRSLIQRLWWAWRGTSWLTLTTLLCLVLILAVLIVLPFRSQQRAELADLRELVTARAMAIDAKLTEVAYQVRSQREAAEALLQPHTELPPSPLFMYLDNSAGDVFGLDFVPAQLVSARVGNIYGAGSLAQSDAELRREIQMVLWLFPLHRAALRTTPELAWVYYNSVRQMYAISPWVSHQQMLQQTHIADIRSFLRGELATSVIQLGSPERNPQRMPYWTTPYWDPAGRGLMVSYGAPVYDGNQFRGVVGADLTLSFLKHHVERGQLLGGRLFVVAGQRGKNGIIITSDDLPVPHQPLPALAAKLKLKSEVLDELLATPGDFKSAGHNYLIAIPVKQADWLVVYEVPRSRVILGVIEQLQLAGGVVVVLLLLLVYTFHRLRYSTLALQQQATRDALTGALNRRALFGAIEHERARQRRGGSLYALIMIDIDFFKQVNDLHGHGAGDEVLRQVAVVLQAHLRDTDLLARVGGEEFIVLLPDSDPATAIATAERLRKQVEALSVNTHDKTIQVTISLGITIPAHADEAADQTYQRADVALYAAKYAGRNCCKSFFMAEQIHSLSTSD